MLVYSLALDWARDNSLIDNFEVMRGFYKEPSSQKARGLVVRPFGGSVPGTVQRYVLSSFVFISSVNDDLENLESSINSIINATLCKFTYKGYNISCTTGLPQPTLNTDGRVVYELFIRIE